MAYSSIIRKTCKCGCSRMPSLGYAGYNQNCNPKRKQEILDKMKQRQANALQQSKTKPKPSSSLKSSVRGLVDKNIGKDKVIGSKSELLRLADRAFSDFIKNRDVKDGKFTCPCCNKTYFAKAMEEEEISDEDVDVLNGVDSEGKRLICTMHFVDRDIYSLRFDEDNAAAGCSYCNLRMHLHPKDVEYQNFRKHLVGKFGEQSVAEMELQKRKINKLEITMLKNVIEHYS